MEFHLIRAEELTTCRSRLTLASHSIQVHAFSLAASSDVEVECSRWLSGAEHDRARRFQFERDRRPYIVAHGYLRYLLGRYCGLDPADVKLRVLAGGKPVLVGEDGDLHSIQFSLTHSHGHGLVAVAGGIDVGVDLEPIRQTVDYLKLAERFFSPTESQAIQAKPGPRQRAAFFHYWVGKEAVLKARGTGLQFPLDQCELVFIPHEDAAVVGRSDSSEGQRQWVVRFLSLTEGWVGAVAAEGADWTVISGCEDARSPTR